MWNTLYWHVNPAYDAPKLRSPQPCPHGIACDFKAWNRLTKTIEPACCRYVHPGEEGTGRRFFRQREQKEAGPEATFFFQPACVRLVGAAQGFYERRAKKIPWRTWCQQKGIVIPSTVEPLTIKQIMAPRPRPLSPRHTTEPGVRVEQWTETCETCGPSCDGDHSADRDRPTIPKRWEPDCLACDPQSGCDGDHAEEFRNGMFIRKSGPGQPLSLLAPPPRPIEEPDANGRMWYDSATPVGALAQALMASEKVGKVWHPLLIPIVKRSTPEELSVALGLAEQTNIETSPYHYAQCVVSRAQRELASRS